MIENKKQLKEILAIEKELYLPNCNRIKELRYEYTKEPIFMLWKYIKTLRVCEYQKNRKKSILSQTLLAIYRRKKNKIGLKVGLEIHENCFGPGLLIYHGNIVINSATRVGKNCKLHGMNCIGNKGTDTLCPVLGDNVEVGFGAGIFGEVDIPSGCIIGANAVVIKTPEKKSVLVGVPAKEMGK